MLLKKQEEICIELGNKSNLGSCYWIWADIDAAQGDRLAQKQKLQQSLALFAELNMPRQRDDVQAELDQLNSAEINGMSRTIFCLVGRGFSSRNRVTLITSNRDRRPSASSVP